MYRVGHRLAHHTVLFAAIGLGLAVVVVVSIFAGRMIFQPHTILKQAKPVTHTVTAHQMASQQITKDIFAFQLPAGWHSVSAPAVRYHVYSWAGSGAFDSARRLDVYIDSLPLELAVNRLLPVQANGDQLDAVGSVSYNCVNFTNKSTQSAATGQAPSKWAGVNFLCDMGNYQRDVVATGSLEGVNHTTLTGRTAGRHQVLLIYTDNNSSPDYTIFVTIVKSFHLL